MITIQSVDDLLGSARREGLLLKPEAGG